MKFFFFHRILTRWRVEDYTDGLDPTAWDFKRLLLRLGKDHEFISTSQLEACFKENRSPDPRWIHISFDDGFVSTLAAAEICAGLKIPLTVFISSRVLDGYIPWFVRMRHALSTAGRRLSFEGRVLDPRKPRQAMTLNRLIKEKVYSSPAAPDQVIEEILLALGLDKLPEFPEKHRFLRPVDVGKLRSLGVEIGSHGATHRALVGLNSRELDQEITASCCRLEELTGKPIRSFSYPDGRYDEMAGRALMKAGIPLAFAVGASPGVLNPLALKRQWLGRHIEDVGRDRWRAAFRFWDRASVRVARSMRGF